MQYSVDLIAVKVFGNVFSQEELVAPVEKLDREVVGRLLWRPEDVPDRLEHSIEQYNTKVLELVEVKLCI